MTSENAIPDWAQNIAKRRRDMGISQSKLAERLHVSQSAVADWERGKSRPRPAYWASLARELNTTLDNIFPELEVKEKPFGEWIDAKNSDEMSFQKSLLISDQSYIFGQLFSEWMIAAERGGLFFTFADLASQAFDMWQVIKDNPSDTAIESVIRGTLDHRVSMHEEALERAERVAMRRYRVKP